MLRSVRKPIAGVPIKKRISELADTMNDIYETTNQLRQLDAFFHPGHFRLVDVYIPVYTESGALMFYFEDFEFSEHDECLQCCAQSLKKAKHVVDRLLK